MTNTTNSKPKLIPPHGGYKKLEAYKTAAIITDGTAFFCEKYMSYKTNKSHRTYDQMVQAARSGKQNIVEGSMASGTSKKTELKLIGVARASFEELLEDYQDFLRQRNLPIWGKDSAKATKIRRLAYKTNKSYTTYKTYIESVDAETAANTLICLLHQENYLLDQLKKRLDKDFLEKGGFTERMYATRSDMRRQKARKI